MSRGGAAVFWALALGVLALAWWSGVMHDYSAYLGHWSNAMSGLDPWDPRAGGTAIPVNAYGPLHLVVGWPAALHPLLPKLLIAGAGVGVHAVLVRAALREGGASTAGLQLRIAGLYLLFPVTLVAADLFGNNDALVALAVVLACEARRQERHGLTGGLLGLAALLKFYPLLFVPFFAAGTDGRFHLRGLAAAAAVFACGMAAAYGVWGASVMDPIGFGGVRGAKLLSILNPLGVVMEAAGLEPAYRALLAVNGLMVVATATLVALHGWLARLDWRVTALAGILAVFLVYKVGHPQFHLTWLAVLAWVLVSAEAPDLRRFARSLVPVALYLGAFQIVYLTSGLGTGDYLLGPWGIVREVASVPLVALAALGLYRARAVLLRSWRRGARLVW